MCASPVPISLYALSEWFWVQKPCSREGSQDLIVILALWEPWLHAFNYLLQLFMVHNCNQCQLLYLWLAADVSTRPCLLRKSELGKNSYSFQYSPMAKMAIVKMPLIQLQTNGTSYKAKDETTEKLPTCHQTSKPNVSSLPTTPILSCKNVCILQWKMRIAWMWTIWCSKI